MRSPCCLAAALAAAVASIWPATAAGQCSVHRGKVVFNEVNSPASGASFLELKVIDNTVLAATGNLAGWKIGVWRTVETKVRGNSVYTTTSSVTDLGAIYASAANVCGVASAWLVVPDNRLADVIAGLNNNQAEVVNLNLVLYEESAGSKRIVDILRLAPAATNPRTIYGGHAACAAIETGLPASTGAPSLYDAIKSASGASQKNWFRNPDGTGTWNGTETGNDRNTSCASNSGASPPSAFAAYEASVGDAAAAVEANRTIRTRVASASGNLCTSGGTCALTVASFGAAGIDTSYSGTVTAALEHCANVVRAGGTVACGGSWSAISGATREVNLASGKGSVVFGAVANAFEMVRVRISSATVPGGPWVPTATTSHFAIRPAALTLAASGPNGSLLTSASTHKAGQAFTLGAASGFSNYPGTAPGPVVAQRATTVPAPAAGGVTGDLVPGAWTAGGGTVTSTTATYSEVGTFALTLEDRDYANIDAIDSSVAERHFSGSASLGRFIPDHFVVTAPALEEACASGATPFTYFGQDGFVTRFTLTARNAFNAPTLNYLGAGSAPASIARLPLTTWGAAPASMAAPGFGFAVSAWSPAQAAGVALAAGAVAPTASNGNTWVAGTTTVTARHRLTAPATPVAPTSVTVTVLPVDADGVTLAAPAVLGTTRQRFGRLRLANAFGPATGALAMPVQAHYWGNGSWILNSDDSCTAIAANSVFLAGDLAATTTASAINLAGGLGMLTLTKSNDATGSVDAAINLGLSGPDQSCLAAHGGTPAQRPWLRSRNGDCATTYDRDPSARATFGIHAPETRKTIDVR